MAMRLGWTWHCDKSLKFKVISCEDANGDVPVFVTRQCNAGAMRAQREHNAGQESNRAKEYSNFTSLNKSATCHTLSTQDFIQST
jgi:hypothetical protein